MATALLSQQLACCSTSRSAVSSLSSKLATTQVRLPGLRKAAVHRRTSLSVKALLTAEKEQLDIKKMAPLGDRVLVKPVEEAPQTAGGILLPSSATKGVHSAYIGEVLALGDETDVGVKVGDTILYSKSQSSDVETAEGNITFVAQKSVLAILS